MNETATADVTLEWKKIYCKRRDRLRGVMANMGLDALLVSNAANRFYLSGFELHDGQPGESSGALVITRSGGDWLATDDRFLEAAAHLWDDQRVFVYGGKRKETIADLLPQCGFVIGFESNAVSFDFYNSLLRRCGRRIQLLPVWGEVERLRMIKEPCELAAIESSYALNHAMLQWLEDRQKAGELIGLSEQDLAWQVESYFRNHGASELAFSVIAANGKNSAMPHAIPGANEISSGTPLLMDVGCRVANYCSDQTRTWWLGASPSAEFCRFLELVQVAQARAMEIMRPGVRCADVYHAANEIFEQAGVASAFTHGLGHGIGLETHELPSLSPNSNVVLMAGMTITVEPGLYFPEWGGIRWEHAVVVEESGVRVL